MISCTIFIYEGGLCERATSQYREMAEGKLSEQSLNGKAPLNDLASPAALCLDAQNTTIEVCHMLFVHSLFFNTLLCHILTQVHLCRLDHISL